MKKILYVMVCLQIYSLHGSWTIVQIDNQTDLTLVQAIRNYDVEIGSISQIFKNAHQNSSIILPKDALFGTSGGCKIVAFSALGDQYIFSFFGDVTHRVGNGRASFADRDSRNAAALIREPMIARVFQTYKGIMKLIGSIGFDDEHIQFKLTLVGLDGNYQAKLAIV